MKILAFSFSHLFVDVEVPDELKIDQTLESFGVIDLERNVTGICAVWINSYPCFPWRSPSDSKETDT
jgi:hypothetical protein